MRTRWRHKADLKGDVAFTTNSDGSVKFPYAINPIVKFEYMQDELNDFRSLGTDSSTDIGGPLSAFSCEFNTDGLGPPRWSQNFFGKGRYDYVLPLPPRVGEDNLNMWGPIDAAVDARKAKVSRTKKEVEDSAAFYRVAPGPLSGLDASGTTAINRCRPTVPAADTATTLAELVSERGFFSAPGTNSNLSGEYLNYSLGIAPTAGFAQDLRAAIEESDRIIAQYERDAGRLVRRTYQFPEETTTSTVTRANVLPLALGTQELWGSGLGVVGTQEETTKTTIKTWFSGAFTYSVPEKGWRRTLSSLDQVYGIIPGPDTAWELIPFSFVADYFANFGDVLGNLSSFIEDGLVMPYGYVMREETRITDAVLRYQYRPAKAAVYENAVATIRFKFKRMMRQPATPFGFGFDWGSVTPRQLSILAALGISRVL